MIFKTWQRQIFAKKLLAGLVDRLQDSIQGERIKSKEIADLVRQEFNLPANVVVPIKAIKQDPNFIINNYAKILELTQKNSKKTWENLVPNKKLDIEEDKSQLNEDDNRFLQRIEFQNNINVVNEVDVKNFVKWVRAGYISDNRQSLNEVYDWYMAIRNRINIFNFSAEQAVDESERWHQEQILKEKNIGKVEEYQKGRLGDQVVTVDDKSMNMVNVHSNIDLVKEGELMGHCVGGENYWRDVENGEKEIYSLRDSNNEPHVTIDVRDSEVWQVYGKSDSRPNSEYMPFIRKWIEDNDLEVMGTELNTYSWLEIVSDNELWDERYFFRYFGMLENGKRKKVEQYTKDEREALNAIQKYFIKNNDANNIYRISQYEGANIFELENALIKIQEANKFDVAQHQINNAIVNFAAFVKQANIGKLQDIIIASNDIDAIVRFANIVNGADISRLQEIVLKSKKMNAIADFADKVDGADIDKLQDFVIKNGNEYDIWLFATKNTIKNKSKLFDTIVNKKEIIYVYRFVRDCVSKSGDNIKNSNKKNFYDLLYSQKDMHLVYQFLSLGALWLDKNILEDIIVQSGDAHYIWLFAKGKQNNIEKLEDAIIKSRNEDKIFDFARDVNGANIKKLEDAIIEIGDAKKIYFFARYINGANIERLHNAVVKTGESYIINQFNEWFEEELKDKKQASAIYKTWQRSIKAKLSVEELHMAEEAAKKRKEGLIWGPMFQEERTYFSYKTPRMEVFAPQEINSFLQDLDYEIIDYRQGLAKKSDKKQTVGIGKILTRENRPDLKKMFDERLGGRVKEYEEPLLAVFSHKPEDIAASSTDRNWKSCMDLREGTKYRQLFNKITKGGLVVYLIKESDKNIENPLARMSTRRYEDRNGNFIFMGNSICYGVKDMGFIDFANDILHKSNIITSKQFSGKLFRDIEKGYGDVFGKNFNLAEYIDMYKDRMSEEEIEKFEDMIINSGDATAILYFAENVPNTDVHLLQSALIKSTKRSDIITRFAEYIKGADIPLLQSIVEKYGNAGDLYRFGRDVNGADKESLTKAFMKKDVSAEDIFQFAYSIADKKDIPMLEDETIKLGDNFYILKFAEKIEGANKKKLEDAYTKLTGKKFFKNV